MNRTVIAVIVVVVIVVIVYLVASGGNGVPAGEGLTPEQQAAAESATYTEEQLRGIVTSMPKEAWARYPAGVQKQLEDYVREHPEILVGPTLSEAVIRDLYETMPRDEWKKQPASIQHQLEEYAKTQGQ